VPVRADAAFFSSSAPARAARTEAASTAAFAASASAPVNDSSETRSETVKPMPARGVGPDDGYHGRGQCQQPADGFAAQQLVQEPCLARLGERKHAAYD
jgi:hypothetical protein